MLLKGGFEPLFIQDLSPVATSTHRSKLKIEEGVIGGCSTFSPDLSHGIVEGRIKDPVIIIVVIGGCSTSSPDLSHGIVEGRIKDPVNTETGLTDLILVYR